MDSEKLLDAIGLVDDCFLQIEERKHLSIQRKMMVFIAAILLIALSIGSVIAMNGAIRERFLSILRLETHERPPEGQTGELANAQSPSAGLKKIGIVDIEGKLYAHYFAGNGFVRPVEGGFYTSSWWEKGQIPDDGVFWEVRREGAIKAETKRVDFPFYLEEKTLQITLDYAVLNNRLCIQIWQRGLEENPVGNGWNVVPIGTRTDIALMSIPVKKGLDYTQELYLLDLTSLETRNLLSNVQHDHLTVYAARLTQDLRYALLSGFDESKDKYRYTYWLCDLESGEITQIEDLAGAGATEPYFLDSTTLICELVLDSGNIHVVRINLKTKQKTVVVANVPRKRDTNYGYMQINSHGAGGVHGLLYDRDGNAVLVDLRSGDTESLFGLDLNGAMIQEGPDAQFLFIAYGQTAKDEPTSKCYPEIGMLNPKEGVLYLLKRDISGNAENFWGWLDSNTVAFTSRNSDGSYYIYLYELA